MFTREIRPANRGAVRVGCCLLSLLCSLGFLFAAAVSAGALPPKDLGESETTILVEVPASEADVLQAVKEVSEDQIIHGTYVYEKDKTLTGAHAAASSSILEWQGPGKVFYKVADGVLAPRHFQASNDMGTITVRYVVQGTGPTTTSVRIDAVFVETARRRVDRSEGSVEGAEYEAIKQHVDAIDAKRRQEQDEVRKLQEDAENRVPEEKRLRKLATSSGAAESQEQELEKRVQELRQKVEARTKTAGVPLKSAPFRSASTLKPLEAKSEVVVLIVTPYWYGVETQDGRHGWIRRSELEPLP